VGERSRNPDRASAAVHSPRPERRPGSERRLGSERRPRPERRHGPDRCPGPDHRPGPASTVAPGPTAVPDRAAAEPRGVVGEWIDGLRVVTSERRLRWGLVVNGLARRLEPGRLLGISLLVFAVIDLATWNGPLVTTGEWPYLGLFVAAGIPGIGVLTGLTALVQERTEDADLGRVLATFYGSFNGLTALGMLLAGLLGDAVGVVPVLNGQAGLYLVAVASLGGVTRPPAGTTLTTKCEGL
jgi:hypothetical protein